MIKKTTSVAAAASAASGPSVAVAASSAPARSARERLLAAAEQLFYEEGINTVGIDRVIERAGVAKASLYDLFGSKEELIRSYLLARHESRQARIKDRLARYDNPRDRLLGVFDVMAELLAQPDFRGCAFVRASAEVRPGSSVKTVCDESRLWTKSLFIDLAKDAGAPDPEALAQQLVLLYDGASVSAQMDGNRGAALTARAAASLMLDQALKTPALPRKRTARGTRTGAGTDRIRAKRAR
jgi:AcrR family transcriptional regulator